MTNGIGHRVIAISRFFLNDQWKFLHWWLLSKNEYNAYLLNLNTYYPCVSLLNPFQQIRYKLCTLLVYPSGRCLCPIHLTCSLHSAALVSMPTGNKNHRNYLIVIEAFLF